MTQRRKLEDYMRTIYSLRQKGVVRGADIADVLPVRNAVFGFAADPLDAESWNTVVYQDGVPAATGRIWWKEENMQTPKPYHPDDRGYEVIQAGPPAEGELLGGCIDVFPEFIGTVLWPEREDWEGKLLMVETSEEDMPPEYLTWYLRGLAAQGIFDAVKGVLVGRPARRSRWEDYKAAYRRVIGLECGRPDLPILGNLNFGHADPIGVFPLGVRARMDTAARTLTLLESATE